MENCKDYIVYYHKNKTNGKVYFGCTRMSLKRRWNGYITEPFASDVKKYRWHGFIHGIICSGLTKDEALSIEKSMIDWVGTNNPNVGYNRNENSGKWNLGQSTPEHTRQKMSKAMKKKVLCVETGEIFLGQEAAGQSKGIRTWRSISKACLGMQRTVGGFHWEYVEDEI